PSGMIHRRENDSTGKLPLTQRQRRQLLQALHSTQDAKIYRRLLVVIEIDRGRSPAQIAATLHVGRASIYLWVRRYLQHRDTPWRSQPTEVEGGAVALINPGKTYWSRA